MKNAKQHSSRYSGRYTVETDVGDKDFLNPFRLTERHPLLHKVDMAMLFGRSDG